MGEKLKEIEELQMEIQQMQSENLKLKRQGNATTHAQEDANETRKVVQRLEEQIHRLNDQNDSLRRGAWRDVQEKLEEIEELQLEVQQVQSEKLKLKMEVSARPQAGEDADEMRKEANDLRAENRRLRRSLRRQEEAMELAASSNKAMENKVVSDGYSHTCQIERLLSLSDQHQEIVQRLFPSDCRRV